MPTTLITGANRGIGLEFARAYAAEDWRVHACCRAPDAAADLNALAAESDGRVTIHPLEVTDGGQVAALAGTIREPVDLLLNNAGVNMRQNQSIDDMDYDRWAELFAVNAMAPLRLADAFADAVAASEKKLMVTISSRMGSIGGNEQGNSIAYRSSKTAVNQVMRSVAFQLGGKGVISILFHPGWVRTDMGGPNGAIGAAESVAAMCAVIAGLTPADNGRFLNYDGEELPW